MSSALGDALLWRVHRASTVTRSAVAVALIAVGTLVAVTAPAEAQGPPPERGASGVLRLRQLSVGQGDAALITTPEGRRILIDAGPSTHVVADLLWAERIDTLDLVIASHNHADHIGGIAEVFFSYAVRAYVENGIPHTTGVYQRTLAAVEQEPGLQYLEATDRTITVGSVRLRLLPPPRTDNSQNNNSVGVLIEYGRFRALYTGDSEQPELESWLRDGRAAMVTVVKVAHHGSWNGTSDVWTRATRPAVAIISVGPGGRYGHPSPDVERQWAAVGARVYRTDRDGTIEVAATADGRFSIRTQLGAAAAAVPAQPR